MAYLVVEGPGEERRRLPIGPGENVIGRDKSCELQVVDPAVSRRHAVLFSGYLLRDLGSTNGVFYQGRQVQEEVVSAGDSFQLGSSGRIRMRIEGGNIAGQEPETDDDETRQVDLRPPGPASQDEVETGEPLKGAQPKPPEREPTASPAPTPQATASGLETVQKSEGPLSGKPPELPADSAPEPAAPAESNSPSAAASSESASVDPELLETIQRLRDRLDQLSPLVHRVDELEQEKTSLEDEKARLTQQVNTLRSKVIALQERAGITPSAAELDGPLPALAGAGKDTIQSEPEPASEEETGEHTMVSNESPKPQVGEDVTPWLLALFGADTPDLGKARPNVMLEDVQFILGSLFSFSRDLERVVTRMAQQFKGVRTPEVTRLPGTSVNLTARGRAVLTASGPQGREAMNAYMDDLRSWTIAVIGAYNKGAESWAKGFLKRLAPATLRKNVNLGKWKQMAGLEYQELWKAYERIIGDLTPEIIADQIEESAADAARKAIR